VKSITLHGISDALGQKIAERRRTTGLSQNRTVIQVLENALLPSESERRKAELMTGFGSWTEEDAAEFDEAIKELNEVREEEWEDEDLPE
jgi:hypothetical protein